MSNQKRKRTSIMNINWKLPDDIVKVIISKLSFSNLPNCRIVCKAWNHLILDYTDNHSSKFLFHPNAFLMCPNELVCTDGKFHICNSKIHCFHFDTINSVATLGFDGNRRYFTIRNSCNGLLQISYPTKYFDEHIGILNPMTSELIDISPHYEEWYGFGFSPKTKEYKLFRQTIFETDTDEIMINTIEVWRFGINIELQRWKPLSSQPTFSIECDGFYFDGVIYWIGNDITNEFVIYGLNVETEVFETIAILDVGPYSTRYHGYFQQFNTTLYLIIKMNAPVLKMQVWIRRAKHSWIKEFVFDLSNDDKLLRFIKVDEGRLYFHANNHLFYFDKSGKKIKLKTLSNPNKTIFKTNWHIESFHFGSLPKILAGNNRNSFLLG